MELTRDAGEALDAGLRAAVSRIARVPLLLVACDYDGTLAPLVDDPAFATPLPSATATIRALASLPQTTVAVISGRSLRDLAALSRMPSEVQLVGSHGTEFDVGFVGRIQPELAHLRTRLDQAALELAREHPGVKLEQKPASVAVHTRGAGSAAAAAVIDRVRTGPATWPGVHVTTGRDVVELGGDLDRRTRRAMNVRGGADAAPPRTFRSPRTRRLRVAPFGAASPRPACCARRTARSRSSARASPIPARGAHLRGRSEVGW